MWLLVPVAVAATRRVTAWAYGRHAHERDGVLAELARWHLDDIYLGDCGANVAWCDGDDCTRVVCEGSRIGNGAPWCEAETLVRGAAGRWRLVLDEAEYALCGPMIAAARSSKTRVHMLIRYLPPDAPALAADLRALAATNGWAGINVDDESDGCPRRDWAEFEVWVRGLGELASSGVEVSADVQYLSCVKQSHGTYERELRPLLASVPVTWVEMDTYFGELDYFNGQLRYYTHFVPLRQLGVGIYPTGFPNMSRPGFLARLCLFEAEDVRHVSVFLS